MIFSELKYICSGDKQKEFYQSILVIQASSSEQHVPNLTDNSPDTFWQSSGTGAGHWLLLVMEPGRVITSLNVQVGGLLEVIV